MTSKEEEFAEPTFNVFQQDKADVTFQERYISFNYPMDSMTNDNDIKITIPSQTRHWMDMQNSVLEVEARIVEVKADGKIEELTATRKEPVIFINNGGHSLFRDIQLSINQQPIEGGQNTYATQAFLNNHLQFSQGAKDTHMFTQGYSILRNAIKYKEHRGNQYM